VFCCPGGWTGKGYQPIYFRSSGKISDLSQTPCPSRLSAVIGEQVEVHFCLFCRRGRIELAVSLGNKLPDPLICLRQRLLIRQEYDAEVLGSGLLAKAGAVHHKYMLLQAKFFDENIVSFRDIEPRES